MLLLACIRKTHVEKKIMFFTTNNIFNNYNQDFNFLQKYSIIHLPIHPSFVIFIHVGLQLSAMTGQVKLQTEQTRGTKYRNVNLPQSVSSLSTLNC